MRVRVSAQMGVMTEAPDSPLLRKPQWVWAYRHCVGLVRDGKVAEGVFASGPGLG